MGLYSITFKIACIIFLLEAVVMLALSHVQPVDGVVMEALLDSLSLTLLSTPLIYRWVIRPYIRKREEAELTLREEHRQQLALIDQLKAAQAQLLQSEKMAALGQLAAGVAHEINNPVGYVNCNIGALAAYAEDLMELLAAYEAVERHLNQEDDSIRNVTALKQRLDLPYLKEDLRKLIDESKEGLVRVRQIVQDLKDFSRSDEATWQTADLHTGINATLNIVHNEIKYKADVIKEYGDLPPIECIPAQINQVILNLLVNAAHAMDRHGTITIRTGAEGEHVWLDVIDTGKGIPREHLARIFDPFFTTKPVGVGTGLGLSISYGIIKKHRGSIEVESEPGKGTRFHIVLPVHQDEAEPAAGGQDAHTSAA